MCTFKILKIEHKYVVKMCINNIKFQPKFKVYHSCPGILYMSVLFEIIFIKMSFVVSVLYRFCLSL